MGARRSYPQYKDYTAEEMLEFLHLCKLSDRKKDIAAKCILCTDMPLIEIGEEHGGLSRATITRWMEKDILPELDRIICKKRLMMCRFCTQTGAKRPQTAHGCSPEDLQNEDHCRKRARGCQVCKAGAEVARKVQDARGLV